MKLFDDIQRADTSPARLSESSYQFLNPVAGAPWDKVRALLEAWFADHRRTRNEITGSLTSTMASTSACGGSCTSQASSCFSDMAWSHIRPLKARTVSRISSLVVQARASMSKCTVASSGEGAGTRDASRSSAVWKVFGRLESPYVRVHDIAAERIIVGGKGEARFAVGELDG